MGVLDIKKINARKKKRLKKEEVKVATPPSPEVVLRFIEAKKKLDQAKKEYVQVREETYNHFEGEIGRHGKIGIRLSKVFKYDHEAMKEDGIDVEKYRMIREGFAVYMVSKKFDSE
jgi:hypothetical protein